MREYLRNTLYWFSAIMISTIIALLFVVDKTIQYACQNQSLLSNGYMCLVIAAGFTLLAIIYINRKTNHIQKFENNIKEQRHYNRELFFLCVCLFIVQVFIAKNIYFLTDWDAGILRDLSNWVVTSERPENCIGMGYLSMYPNNFFLFTVFFVLKKTATIIGLNLEFFLIIVAGVMFSCSVGMVSQMAYSLTGSVACGRIAYVISVVLFGISPWITIPYSDSYGVFFTVAPLFVYVCGKKIPFFLRVTLMILLAEIGCLIKPQCAIFLIALVISACLTKEICFRRVLAVALAAVLCTCGLRGVVSFLYMKMPEAQPDDRYEIPMTHFVMMGLNEETCGIYSEEDVQFTKSVAGKEERIQLNIEAIKKRIDEMGFVRLMKHFARKTLVNYNDGMYAWGKEGTFYKVLLEKPYGEISAFLRNIFYTDGLYYGIYATGVQLVWILVLIGVFLAVILKKTANQGEELLLILSIVGITMFTLIFEARARYLFIYSPYYVLLSVIGMDKLLRLLKDKQVMGK